MKEKIILINYYNLLISNPNCPTNQNFEKSFLLNRGDQVCKKPIMISGKRSKYLRFYKSAIYGVGMNLHQMK